MLPFKTIEDVILTADRRGMQQLRDFLPEDFCGRAAWALHGSPERVLIASGFHVEQKCETDGPPGAIAIARAMRALGGQAVIVSDGHAASVLAQLEDMPLISLDDFLAHPIESAVVDFPVVDPPTSDTLARQLLEWYKPTACVAIERCGASEDGLYRNMRGEDISALTARLDALFEQGVTIDVGDGGNEIGMGSLAQHCIDKGITRWPCRTPVLFPVIASVSNWGAYGICAGLSQLAGRNLLPGEEEANAALELIVMLDGLDGVTRQASPTVDGHTPGMNLEILSKLHAIVESSIGP